MEALAEMVWLMVLVRLRLLAGSSRVRVAILAVAPPVIAYCIGSALGVVARRCGI